MSFGVDRSGRFRHKPAKAMRPKPSGAVAVATAAAAAAAPTITVPEEGSDSPTHSTLIVASPLPTTPVGGVVIIGESDAHDGDEPGLNDEKGQHRREGEPEPLAPIQVPPPAAGAAAAAAVVSTPSVGFAGFTVEFTDMCEAKARSDQCVRELKQQLASVHMKYVAAAIAAAQENPQFTAAFARLFELVKCMP